MKLMLNCQLFILPWAGGVDARVKTMETSRRG